MGNRGKTGENQVTSQNMKTKKPSISVKTWSTVFENPEFADEYSVSEFTCSFTLGGQKNQAENEDTDIEADDEFNEYSEVTFDCKEHSLIGKSNIEKVKKLCIHPSCTTHCASTYSNSRERRKTLSSLSQKKEFSLRSSFVSEESDESLREHSSAPVRKLSKFKMETMPEKKLIEGTFVVTGSINFEKYLGKP